MFFKQNVFRLFFLIFFVSSNCLATNLTYSGLHNVTKLLPSLTGNYTEHNKTKTVEHHHKVGTMEIIMFVMVALCLFSCMCSETESRRGRRRNYVTIGSVPSESYPLVRDIYDGGERGVVSAAPVTGSAIGFRSPSSKSSLGSSSSSSS